MVDIYFHVWYLKTSFSYYSRSPKTEALQPICRSFLRRPSPPPSGVFSLLHRPASSPSSTVRRLLSPLANDTSLLLPLRLASLALRHLQFSPRRPSPPPSGVFSLLRQSASLLLPLRLPSLALRHLFPSEIPLLRLLDPLTTMGCNTQLPC
ncbi:uncharacterized protein LOC114322437 [Camellia sinensis]|uniref:uncharacterized protein LOC114322437 n=1 Tax=Camellia sinensis TaxID=4442 RepID=UPI001035668B|nr:uncharacterized protein LOC114322437 [Camellia sinensis]